MRLLDEVRQALRVRHYSRRTEQAYVMWMKRYFAHYGMKHPAELGADEVNAFLCSLATEQHVAASTQNQAQCALLFLYDIVLGQPLEFDAVVRAKRPKRLPVVMSRSEVVALLAHMEGMPRLMASLLYGSGLRLLECARLRIKDVDFERGEIRVRDGKGRKDRVAPLPGSLVARSPPTSSACAPSTSAICVTAPASSSCRAPSPSSSPGRRASGRGSGSSPPPATTRTARPVSDAATTSTRAPCSAP